MKATKSLPVIKVNVKDAMGWNTVSYQHLLVITPLLGRTKPHSLEPNSHTMQTKPLKPTPHTKNGEVSTLMRAMLHLECGLYE